MSILYTKNNKEKINETGAKKSKTKAIIASTLATLIVLSGAVTAVGLNSSHQEAKKDISSSGAFYCDVTECLENFGSNLSANHIIEHLNENKYVSNIEYQESEMVSQVPQGYIKVTIVERTYTKEDGTKVKEYEEPLYSLWMGEYKYTAPNGGTIKIMGKKEYKDSNGEIHTEYVEPIQMITPPTITFEWKIPETDETYRVKYAYSRSDNEWKHVSKELIQNKELTKTK